MKEVHKMLRQACHIEIRHIYREANMAEDWLSKYRYAITGSRSTTECFSMEIQDIVKDNVIGCTLVRRSA